MAVPPCVDGLCGVTSNVDGDGRLEIGLDLAAAGGLECTGGEAGQLSVKLDTTAGCDQLLSLSAAGLLAARPKAGIITDDGAAVDYPATGAVAQSNGFQIHNTAAHTTSHACPKLLIVTTRWQFQYEIQAVNGSGVAAGGGEFYVDIGGFDVELGWRIDGGDLGTAMMSQTHTHLTVLEPDTTISIQSGGRARTTDEGTINGSGDNFIRTFNRILVVELDIPSGGGLNGVAGITT